MSLTKATNYLKEKGYADHIIILEQSTATVMEAADALGVKPGMIAKPCHLCREIKLFLS